MNNQKTATSSQLISNLVNSKNRHHLHLVTNQKAPGNKGESNEIPSDDLSVGDWVINGSSRPGEIVKIVELKPGYRSVWVRYSGENVEQRENPEDLTPIDPDDIPKQSQQKTSDLIFNYLSQESDFVSEIVIATELNITVPVARQNLRELGERVEDDGDGNWRCVKYSVAEVVEEECRHNWEFVPAPVEIGFAERCSHCNEVEYIEGSDKLEELIAWLNNQVEEFKQLSDKETDERKQAYYQNCARNKQQLIKQVNRHKEIALEKEKERVLQLQVEIKQLTRSFFVGVGGLAPRGSEADRLKEIIGQKLYKSLGYNTSAVYCPQELGITARQAQRLIAAAEVYHNLAAATNFFSAENTTNWSPPENVTEGSKNLLLPSNESQCRVLAQLKNPTEQREVWKKGLAIQGKIPSAKTLSKIIESRQKPMSTSTKYPVDNQQPPSPKIERVTKYGKLTHGNIRLFSPKVMEALEQYIEVNGIASFDGAIARLLGLD